jgi:sugar-specific transcriptional regulator TrmB
MANAPIELELRKLGLTEKEVKIYLAGLELGPGPVQKIALATKITRPTVYEIIKKLEEKGLFAETKQKTKRFFVAQSPERILNILRTQKREIEEKEREFIRIISSLEEKYSKQEGVRSYKGKEGLESLEEIFSFSPTSNITIVSNTKSLKFKKAFQKIKKRLGEIKLREIKKNLDGTMIIFDKIIFLPSKKQEGFLIENKLVINLIKSILQ